MDKKIKRFLWCSFASVVIVCIMLFTWLTFFVSEKTDRSVKEVGELYMSEMNVQLQQKFQTIIELRLEQVKGIIRRTPPDSDMTIEQILDELTVSANIRNFTYLGMYTEEDELITIHGKKVEIAGSDTMQFLKDTGEMIERGIDEDGEKILLLGISTAYRMEDGKKCVALVAGVSMEYLNQALFLEVEGGNLSTHIIDKNGEFVIRNSDAYRESYFDRIRTKYEVFDGKTPDDYVKELKAAMKENRNYSADILIDGEERNIYCSPLSGNMTWYLISSMPNSVLEDPMSSLDNVRLAAMLGSLIVILSVMGIIFIMYFRLTRLQVQELTETKNEAMRANKAKSEFLSNMSHDIRTPMNAIIGMTEIALKNIEDKVRLEDCLQKVRLSSKHLLGLINDVLDMSKIESGKMVLNMGLLSLRETMDDIVNIIQPQIKAGKLYFDIFIQNIESEMIYCDSVRLNQILLNLLSNAVKFTPEEGRIDVHVYQESSPLGEEYVRTHFVVEDNGIGMSEEFQKRIFETFSREDSEQVQHIVGTGLGTSITKAIVDLMKGTIELQSELGKGSKFHITLDLKRAQEEEDMKLPEWNILVVDDNELLCTSAAISLEELGVHAEWTVDGREAVKMIEERHKNKDDYRFVLIDWKMPNMNGIQTIHEIRARVGRKIPVFLISAYDWSDVKEDAQAAEIEGFISKPLFKSTLYTHLIQYVEDGGNKAESDSDKQEDQVIDFTGRHILLAEDIEINWEIANEILTSFGFEVEHAENGQACVDKFKESEIGFYDVILMDIRMPVMDGFEATKAIRGLKREDKDLPIIAMTANAFSDDVQQCLTCGMNAHVAKPIDTKELIQVLKKYSV